jgi:hypothetical protein
VDVVLPRLPKSSDTISVDDLPSYLAFNETHLSLKEIKEIQQHFLRQCGKDIPIEYLLANNP